MSNASQLRPVASSFDEFLPRYEDVLTSAAIERSRRSPFNAERQRIMRERSAPARPG